MENSNEFIQKFGYTEMYEWADLESVPVRLGIFVQFDKKQPEKVIPYEGGVLAGCTTINSLSISDNPDKWKHANMCNEVGDLYLKKEKLAVGQKVYDEVLEFNYIVTRPWEHFISVKNEAYNPDKKYVPRTGRAEWTKVCLLGKCIVRDNGKCVPGGWCKPYDGKLKINFGTAVPASEIDTQKFYVVQRMTETTILILIK